jgi:hypothetical protein
MVDTLRGLKEVQGEFPPAGVCLFVRVSDTGLDGAVVTPTKIRPVGRSSRITCTCRGGLAALPAEKAEGTEVFVGGSDVQGRDYRMRGIAESGYASAADEYCINA